MSYQIMSNVLCLCGCSLSFPDIQERDSNPPTGRGRETRGPAAPAKRYRDSDDLAVVDAMRKDNFARVYEDIRRLAVVVRNLDPREERVAGPMYVLRAEVKDVPPLHYGT